MATAAVTYTFTAGTQAQASQVNTNYADLVTFLNTNTVHKDGTVTMTGQLTLPSDPTAAGHAARKQYVDDRTVRTLGYAQRTTNQTALYSDWWHDVGSLSVTATTLAGHRIAVATGLRTVRGGTPDDLVYVGVLLDGTTRKQTANFQHPLWTTDAHLWTVWTPSAASHTWKTQVFFQNSSANSTVAADAASVAYIHVMDVGI